MKKYLIFFVAVVLLVPSVTQAALIDDLRGKILIQVEENGEAWYVNPDNDHRYFMGRPNHAFDLMRGLGLGVTNNDLNKIPIGLTPLSGRDDDRDGLTNIFEQSQGTSNVSDDTDGDGFTDREEIENGYSPLVALGQKIVFDQKMIDRLKGKILLQVESFGEAWYVNPDDGKRYFLGRPADAFAVMRNLGLGITNENLAKIETETIDQLSLITEESETSTKPDKPKDAFVFHIPAGFQEIPHQDLEDESDILGIIEQQLKQIEQDGGNIEEVEDLEQLQREQLIESFGTILVGVYEAMLDDCCGHTWVTPYTNEAAGASLVFATIETYEPTTLEGIATSLELENLGTIFSYNQRSFNGHDALQIAIFNEQELPGIGLGLTIVQRDASTYYGFLLTGAIENFDQLTTELEQSLNNFSFI